VSRTGSAPRVSPGATRVGELALLVVVVHQHRELGRLEHLDVHVRVATAECGVGPEVLAFQSGLVEAVAPFVEAGGTAAAFAADLGEPIIDWVDAYVPPSTHRPSRR